MSKLIPALLAVAIALPAQAEPPKVRALTDVYAAGFRDCIPPMQEFVQFVHEDDENYAYLGLWSVDKPNGSMSTVLTSQAFTDGHSISTITAVKTSTGGCNVTLTQSFVVPEQTCTDVKGDTFKEWKFKSDFNGATLFEDPTTPNGHAVMTPVGKTGCLIVKSLLRLE